jgi:formylglycine-generating enzyme required for sulfatase activity
VAQHTFISYAHENSRFAKKLARHLRRHGIPVWLDQWQLTSEVPWDDALGRAISGCRFFLIILSPAAVNSWLVREQFRIAAQLNKEIVPVVRRPCQLPADLGDISPIDFTGPDLRASFIQLVGQLAEPGTVAPETAIGAWIGLSRAWMQPLSRRRDGSWFILFVIFSLVGVITVLVWPEVDATTFADTPFTERLPVVSADLQPDPPPPAPIPAKVRARDGMVMVLVGAGEFWMGSIETDPVAEDDEKPQRRVYLDDFWIDKMEISNHRYELCVEAGGCTPFRSQGRRFEDDFQPVVGVDWHQARAYCQWAGGRLPTEAEWEKAARGLEGRLYPWGDNFDGARLNFCDTNCIADWRDFDWDDGFAYTAPVGSYPGGASPYGALDMSGNVWEWTADWYAPDYYQRSADRNPTGPAFGQQRVIRGGSWYYYGKNLRTTARHRESPRYRYDNIGFRCVQEE